MEYMELGLPLIIIASEIFLGGPPKFCQCVLFYGTPTINVLLHFGAFCQEITEFVGLGPGCL